MQDIQVCRTAQYTLQAKRGAERMTCTIRNGIWTLLIQAGAPSSFWIECVYGVCNRRNCAVLPRYRKMSGELLTDKNPSVRHSQIFRSKAWARVPVKTHSALDAKSRCCVLPLRISYGNYGIMLDEDLPVEGTCHGLGRDDEFSMKKWQSVVLVSSSEPEGSF